METTSSPLPRDAAALAAELVELRRQEARLHARRASVIQALAALNESEARVSGDDPQQRAEFAERSTRAEVACALGVHENTASRLMKEAAALTGSLPLLFSALQAGELTYRHARAALDEQWNLPAEVSGAYDEAIMARGAGVSAAAFARRCRTARERLHPETLDRRHARAVEGRAVTVEHCVDGMSWLHAYVPTTQAELMYLVLSGSATEAQEAGDTRTTAQLRADALCEHVLHGSSPEAIASGAEPEHALRRLTVRLSVTVPILTAMGHGTEPGTIDGVGPIPADVARVLAGNATSWHRVLTHPASGATLDYDRTTYVPPADLRAWLARRDTTCRFPQCSRRAKSCDVDHVTDWAHGGTTAAHNLAHLCRKHHRLKHHSGWRARLNEDSLEWLSPAGITYATESDDVFRGWAEFDDWFAQTQAPPDPDAWQRFSAPAEAP